jgi:hypothetical protein
MTVGLTAPVLGGTTIPKRAAFARTSAEVTSTASIVRDNCWRSRWRGEPYARRRYARAADCTVPNGRQ